MASNQDQNRDQQWLFAEKDRAELAGSSGGIIVVDKIGRIIFANDAAIDMHGRLALGAEPDDYSQMHGLFTEDGHPYPSTDLPLARAVLHGEIIHGARWRIRRPNGSIIMAEGNARPIIKDDGECNGAVLVFREIS